MRVAIVGSREKYLENPSAVRKMVRDYVAALPPDTVIVSGAAPGVDTYASQAGRAFGLVVVEYPADWKASPRGAGMIRNRLVVAQADRVVAFWEGHSPGTADILKLTRRAKKPSETYLVARRRES